MCHLIVTSTYFIKSEVWLDTQIQKIQIQILSPTKLKHYISCNCGFVNEMLVSKQAINHII